MALSVIKTRMFLLLIGGLVAGSSAQGQLVDDFNPPRANCCLLNTAKSFTDQLQDWNQLGRYHQANQQLKATSGDPKRVVFMGDSITDFWKLDDYFPGKSYVDRGISGQTTAQMLVRMYPDVIDLKPAAMVLLAGTNDIARNTGPVTAEIIEQNIMAMTELAQHHGIKVILCALLPVSDYPFLRQQNGPPPSTASRQPPRIRMTEGHPAADILALNAWIKGYAGRVNAIYADYFIPLLDEKGWLKDAYSSDGLHPNAEGYAAMAPIAAAAIRDALQ